MAEGSATRPHEATSREAVYPKRPPFFAHRVVRLAFKTCLAQEIGPTSTMLVIFVAHTEDAKHYSAPPMFYNDQLLPVLGIRKWEALDAARRAAVAAGWLHYDPPPKGSKRRPGVYWTLIPSRFAQVDDAPTDEHYDHIREAYTENGYGEGDRAGYGAGYGAGYREGYREGEPSSLSLNPSPKKRARRFVEPTVEDVRAYCRERNNAVDPQRFVDYYTANGWRVGKNTMRDWKAAVRTWEKNGVDHARNGNSNGSPRRYAPDPVIEL